MILSKCRVLSTYMRHNKKKAVSLDRDGVINKEVGCLHKANDFEFIDGVF